MFLPLYDTESSRYSRWPLATLGLILLNILIFGWQIYYAETHGIPEYRALFRTFGIVPNQIVTREGAGVLTVLTSLFLHGSLSHLFFNMLALWVFGRRVEDACGPGRFLIFYLFCGVSAGLFHVLTHASEGIPLIGASGAIFGVEGAYLILYPGSRIRTFVFVGLPLLLRLPAIWLILYQIPFQIFYAVDGSLFGAESWVGHWAHLGGFFSSIVVVFFLRPWAWHRFWSKEPI